MTPETELSRASLLHQEFQPRLVDDFSSIDIDEIAEYLRRLVKEGKEGAFLIISIRSNKIYVQFSYNPKSEGTVYCEAVSDEYLPKELKLSEDQIWRLKQLGFQSPGSDNGEPLNFNQNVSIANDEEILALAKMTGQIFFDVYYMSADEKLQFRLELG